MTLLENTCACIVPIGVEAARQTQAALDQKTKPPGSLGRLEELAVRLAAIYGSAEPPLPLAAIVVLAADHGVAAEGVSAFPQDVTVQMLRNYVHGGAAINVLARQQRARLIVVDMGTKTVEKTPWPTRAHRLGCGTANFTQGPAMSRATAVKGVEIGIALAQEVHNDGHRVIAVGEMGIGNTTSASAITAALLGLPAVEVTGRGTGIDDVRLSRKINAVERSLAFNRPGAADALGVLAKVGGFEIAGLVGVMLGAAASRIPVVLDGFITGAAALLAVALCPQVGDYFIASHRSAEPGHAAILRHLRLRPLLDLEMRLGEGTGAALALNLVEASLAIVREMATFESTGVANKEP